MDLRRVNPVFNVTLGQLPHRESMPPPLNAACYLLLQVIDASSTCMLAGQSDTITKTYVPSMKSLIAQWRRSTSVKN